MIPLQALLNNLTDPQLAFLTYCVESWEDEEEIYSDTFNVAIKEVQEVADELYTKRKLNHEMFAKPEEHCAICGGDINACLPHYDCYGVIEGVQNE